MPEPMSLGFGLEEHARACRVLSGWMHCVPLEKPASAAGGDRRCGSIRKERVSTCSVLAIGTCNKGR